MAKPDSNPKPRRRGLSRASSLLQSQIRQVGESRGFAVTRLLTHWVEVVGSDIARMARPVKIGYGRNGLGATLTLLTTGAQAPLLQMQLEKIRDKVNTCYGYNAIATVRITQTAPTGFAEGQVAFAPAPPAAPAPPTPETKAKARATTAAVDDTSLRAALETLGENILSRNKS